MKFVSKLEDSRINANNILIEMSIEKYTLLVANILNKNEYQRKRARLDLHIKDLPLV